MPITEGKEEGAVIRIERERGGKERTIWRHFGPRKRDTTVAATQGGRGQKCKNLTLPSPPSLAGTSR